MSKGKEMIFCCFLEFVRPTAKCEQSYQTNIFRILVVDPPKILTAFSLSNQIGNCLAYAKALPKSKQRLNDLV